MNTTPAGWYADPQGEAQYRYWDGTAWTQQVHGPAGATPQAAPQSPPQQAAPPPQQAAPPPPQSGPPPPQAGPPPHQASPQGPGPAIGQPGYVAPKPPRSTGRLVGQIAAVIVGLIVIVVVAITIFGPTTIDGRKVESGIRSVSQTPVRDVSCPDNEPADKGHRFTCNVTFQDGTSQSVTIEVTNSDGHVRIVP
jgi:hypothetical protein